MKIICQHFWMAVLFNASSLGRCEMTLSMKTTTSIIFSLKEGVSKAQQRPQYKSKLATLVKNT